MVLRPTGLLVAVTLLLNWTGPLQARAKTLAIEWGSTSLASEWAGESPPNSGLIHAASLDSGESVLGIGFEVEATRHLGVRLAGARTQLTVAAAVVCPEPECAIDRGGVRYSFGEVDWRVEDESEVGMLLVELPVSFEPGPGLRLFAGPTLARLHAGGVESTGSEALRVAIATSGLSYGFHAGAYLKFPWQARWTLGVIARWIPTDLDFSVKRSEVSGGPLLHTDGRETVSTISVLIGYRFGD